ncbi:MAG: hypothetical protein ACYYK0_05560 [Candidatus Eutrophobiaceae bacterium]
MARFILYTKELIEQGIPQMKIPASFIAVGWGKWQSKGELFSWRLGSAQIAELIEQGMLYEKSLHCYCCWLGKCW